MTENKKLECAIHCLKVNADIEECEECKAYTCGDLACRDIAREAIKAIEEIQMYRDGKLCLIPKDVFKRQCDELEDYKELGTVKDVRTSVEKTNAKKVIYYNRHGDGDDHKNNDSFNCPECGRRLRNKQKDDYCPRCGQKIDWRVKNERNNYC